MSKYDTDLDYMLPLVDTSREELNEIIEEADKIISDNRGNPEELATACLKKAQCLQKLIEIDLDDTEDAQKLIKNIIEKTLEIFPDMPGALMQMGKMYYKTSKSEEGNIKKAINLYTKAIEVKSDYAAAYNNLGILYASEVYFRENNNFQDNLNKAINAYTEAVRIRSFDAIYYLNRGIAYSKLEKHEKAIDDFSGAIDYGSDEFKKKTLVFYLRGDEYLWVRNHEKAIDDFSESMRLIPDHIRSLLMRGNAYLGAGERDKAKADFDEYLRRKRLIEKKIP